MEDKKPKVPEDKPSHPQKPDSVNPKVPHIQFDIDTTGDNPDNFDEGDYEDVNDNIPEREEGSNKET